MAHKKLLILERSGETLTAKDTDGAVFLEGVFTQIGVRNKNNRIYEEKEFLPHVKDLQEKIKNKKLLGELDHPKSFDISLANVSHVIEKLDYDPSTKQVMGRIRLLDTDAGKQAKALVEAGVPLNISSRASGRVDESGKVKIQKLFTYDLVADPGFEAAELHRVNESLGFIDDDHLLIYEFEDQEEEKEKEEIKNENKNIENIPQDMNNYVKIEDFDKYSTYLKNEINQIKESTTGNNADSEAFDKLVQYTEHIAEKLNQMHNYSNYLGENLDKSISHTDYIVENVNKLKNYSNYLAENLQQGISYSEYVANKLEESIDYQNYLAENVQKGIDYTEYIGENVQKGIDYTEYIGENVDKSIQYQNYLAENLEKSISYSDYLKESIEKIGTYADYIAESVNRIHENKDTAKEITTSEIHESVSIETVDKNTLSYQDQISKKLNALLESAVTQKEEDHFFRFLEGSKRNEFAELNENKQSEIRSAFEINKYFSVADATSIWESCFTQKPTALDIVSNMPDKYKTKWESLNESQQGGILAQSKFWPLNTQYQIDNFWQTRDLRAVKMAAPLNESTAVPLALEDKNQAVNEQMENIKKALKARFDKL